MITAAQKLGGMLSAIDRALVEADAAATELARNLEELPIEKRIELGAGRLTVARAYVRDARTVLDRVIAEHLSAVLHAHDERADFRAAFKEAVGKAIAEGWGAHQEIVYRLLRVVLVEATAAEDSKYIAEHHELAGTMLQAMEKVRPSPWPPTERRTCKYCGDGFDVVPELDDDGPSKELWCSTACRNKEADS